MNFAKVFVIPNVSKEFSAFPQWLNITPAAPDTKTRKNVFKYGTYNYSAWGGCLAKTR